MNNYVQPLNATSGGGAATSVSADEPGHVPSGYPDGGIGHDQEKSRASDPFISESDTEHPY